MCAVSLPYPEPGGETFTAGHAGSDASRDRAVAEAEDGTASHRQQATLHRLALCLTLGLTWAELAEQTGWHHGQASGVLSVLHKTGRIERLTERRNRSSVYVLPEYVNGRGTSPFRERVRPLTVTVTRGDEGWRTSVCECGRDFLTSLNLFDHVVAVHNNAPIQFQEKP